MKEKKTIPKAYQCTKTCFMYTRGCGWTSTSHTKRLEFCDNPIPDHKSEEYQEFVKWKKEYLGIDSDGSIEVPHAHDPEWSQLQKKARIEERALDAFERLCALIKTTLTPDLPVNISKLLQQNNLNNYLLASDLRLFLIANPSPSRGDIREWYNDNNKLHQII